MWGVVERCRVEVDGRVQGAWLGGLVVWYGIVKTPAAEVMVDVVVKEG